MAVPGSARPRRAAAGELLERLLVRNLFANGGHLLIHAQCVTATGTFHPGLRYGEDWEYWTRLARLGPFAAVPGNDPLLFVRDRADGARQEMALRPESFRPCVEAIFNAPGLRARLSQEALTRSRRTSTVDV